MKNVEKLCGIYCIENIENGKKYIGQAIDISYRMKLKHKDSPALNEAIKKCGENNFNRYIIQLCQKEELNNLEIYYITILHSHVSENGYNISWGGDSGMQKRNHSDELKQRFSVDGKMLFLGNFKNEIDAAKAYDKYVIENNLDRPLNFTENNI